MRFLLRAIFWLALAYALIPSRAPVPASLKASAPAEQAQVPAERAGNSTTSTGLARDAIALCLDNTRACAAGVKAVGRMAEMARAAGAHFTAEPAATTPAATTPAAGPSPATQAAPVPLPQDRPGDRR